MFGLVTLVSFASAQPASAQHSNDKLVQELHCLVELAGNSKTRQQAEEVFRTLELQAPKDPRVPYAYGLALIERKDYRRAIIQVKKSVQLSGGNLDAWKTYIWLSVVTKDYDGAMATMDRLARQMPATTDSRELEATCVEFASYLGQVHGYLSGPRVENGDDKTWGNQESEILSLLPENRRKAFESARQTVFTEFNGRMSQIEDSRDAARQSEVNYRNEQLAYLAKDREYAFNEMDKIEGLRVEKQNSAANERNTIAATKSRTVGGYTSAAGGSYRNRGSNTYLVGGTNAAGDALVFGNSYRSRNAGRYYSGSAGGFASKQGLDNIHYADVNRREAEYDDYLADRERDLNRRHRRIAKDEANLMKKPITGTNAVILAEINKAKALSTYVELPVSPAQELASIINTYR